MSQSNRYPKDARGEFTIPPFSKLREVDSAAPSFERPILARLRPRLDLAQQHIAMVAGSANADVVIQAWPDGDQAFKKDPRNRRLYRIMRATADVLWPQIVALQKQGAGIGLVLAHSIGRGRKREMMLHPRGVMADIDQELPAFLLAPSFILQTSPGRHQATWIVPDLEWETYDGVEARLVADYGADSEATTWNQAPRLAGTFNLKRPNEAHLTDFLPDSITRPVTAAELVTAYPPIAAEARPMPEPPARWLTNRSLLVAILWRIDHHLQAYGAFSVPGVPGSYTVENGSDAGKVLLVSAIHHESGGCLEGLRLAHAMIGGGEFEGKTFFGDPDGYSKARVDSHWHSLGRRRVRPVTMRTLTRANRFLDGQLGDGAQRSRRGDSEVGMAAWRTVQTHGELVVRRGIHAAVIEHRAVELDAGVSRHAHQLLEIIRVNINPSTGTCTLPPQALLAKDLRVSERTIKRALKELVDANLMVRTAGRTADCYGVAGVVVALTLPFEAPPPGPNVVPLARRSSPPQGSHVAPMSRRLPPPILDRLALLERDAGDGPEIKVLARLDGDLCAYIEETAVIGIYKRAMQLMRRRADDIFMMEPLKVAREFYRWIKVAAGEYGDRCAEQARSERDLKSTRYTFGVALGVSGAYEIWKERRERTRARREKAAKEREKAAEEKLEANPYFRAKQGLGA
jgi:hypothetical protein